MPDNDLDIDELDDEALDLAHPSGDELVAFAMDAASFPTRIAEHVADCVSCGSEVDTIRVNAKALEHADMTLDPQVDFASASHAHEEYAEVTLSDGEGGSEPDEVVLAANGVDGRLTLRNGRLRLVIDSVPADIDGRQVRGRCFRSPTDSYLSPPFALRAGREVIDLGQLSRLTDLVRIRFERA